MTNLVLAWILASGVTPPAPKAPAAVLNWQCARGSR